MKPPKYRKLLRDFPELPEMLELLGVSLADHEFVRTMLGYVAPRLFEKLDLKAISTFKRRAICTGRVGYDMVEYVIFMQLNGAPRQIRIEPDGWTVGDALQYAVDKARTDGHTAVWEYVVRKTVWGSDETLITGMNLEIFPFPHFYMAQPIPRTMIPSPDPAHTAYLTGDPMPPLIPSGSLDFAG